jgi:hypothetical protein
MLLGKRPEPVTLKPQDLAVTTHIASVDLIVHPEPGALVERRIELLEKQVEAHRKATDDLRADLLERLRSATERADEEKVSITRRLAASENLVRDFATEGVRLEGLGLWWVGLGVVLQNLAGLVG